MFAQFLKFVAIPCVHMHTFAFYVYTCSASHTYLVSTSHYIYRGRTRAVQSSSNMNVEDKWQATESMMILSFVSEFEESASLLVSLKSL